MYFHRQYAYAFLIKTKVPTEPTRQSKEAVNRKGNLNS